jgi:hypothetical protein
MYVKSLHTDTLLFRFHLIFARSAQSVPHVTGAGVHNSGRPPQQFSVRYLINSVIALKFAT